MVTVATAGVRLMLGSEVFSLTVSVSVGELSHRLSLVTSRETVRLRRSSENGPRD